jgi:hypothetical protein
VSRNEIEIENENENENELWCVKNKTEGPDGKATTINGYHGKNKEQTSAKKTMRNSTSKPRERTDTRIHDGTFRLERKRNTVLPERIRRQSQALSQQRGSERRRNESDIALLGTRNVFHMTATKCAGTI